MRLIKRMKVLFKNFTIRKSQSECFRDIEDNNCAHESRCSWSKLVAVSMHYAPEYHHHHHHRIMLISQRLHHTNVYTILATSTFHILQSRTFS